MVGVLAGCLITCSECIELTTVDCYCRVRQGGGGDDDRRKCLMDDDFDYE